MSYLPIDALAERQLSAPAIITAQDVTGGANVPTANSFLELDAPGAQTFAIYLTQQVAPLVGTLVAELQAADGLTWEQTYFVAPNTTTKVTSLVNPVNGTWRILGAGTSRKARVRCPNRTSGSIQVDIEATAAQSANEAELAIAASVASVDAKTPTIGQKTKAGSVPMVLASDSDPLPITSISEKTGTATINSGAGGGNTAAIAAPGANTVLVTITPTSALMTLIAEYQTPDGNWTATMFRDVTTDVTSSSIVNPTAVGTYEIIQGGKGSQARVRATPFTSGSVACAFEANANGNYTRHVGFGKYVATPVTLTDGQLQQLALTIRGEMKTFDQGQPGYEYGPGATAYFTPNPDGSSNNTLTNIDSAALENSHVGIAAAGKQFAIDGCHATLTDTAALSCTVANAAKTVTFAPMNGIITVTVSGTMAGGCVLSFEMWDGQQWNAYALTPVGGAGPVSTVSANGAWSSGATPIAMHVGAQFRVRVSTTGTGSATVVIGGPIQLYFQVHNTASLPADGAVPKITVPLSPYQMIGLLSQDDVYGRLNGTGTVWCLSSTLATKTLATGAGGWFNLAARAS